MTAPKENNKFYTDMGSRLKQLRQLKQVSANELADFLGTTSSTILKYERGEIEICPKTIQQLASAFQVPIGYCYGEKHSKIKTSKMSSITRMITNEVMMLPNEERKQDLYDLIKSINENSRQEDHQLSNICYLSST